MRVAAYSGGKNVPSARARIRQYIEPLGQVGVEVREYPLPMGNALPRNLLLWPAWIAGTFCWRALTLTNSWLSDVTWVSRQLLPAFASLPLPVKGPLILDVDDAVWLNTGGHRVSTLAAASDLIVCGNRYLAERFSEWNANIEIIPTAVDTHVYRPRRTPDSGEPPVVGWVGTSGNFPFLYAIEPALARVLKERKHAKLLIVSDKPPRLRHVDSLRVEFRLWSPAVEIEALGEMSLGLMPLIDDPWCAGKCSYKMLCYLAVGLPVVVSPFGMNQDVLDLAVLGFAATTETEWIAAMLCLIDNPQLRNTMGAAGRSAVEYHFSLQALSKRYASVFRSVARESSAESTRAEREESLP